MGVARRRGSGPGTFMKSSIVILFKEDNVPIDVGDKLRTTLLGRQTSQL